MRHSQTKPNSSSNKSNVGSGSGAKLVNVSQKGVSNKRISREPVRCSKKRKLNPGESPAKGKSSTAKKHKKESETEKRHKKVVPTVVKKSCVKVKRLKKPNEKFKRVSAKKDKKALNLQKILKKCKVFEKIEDSYGPPTLCETFSRITSMVAETVINERENQKLTENLMGKGKKEADGSGSSKGKDGNASRKGASEATSSSKVKKETSAKKVEANKKVKTISPKSKVSKMKGGDVKKAKVSGKKSNEKPTLDNTENMVKVLKDEEIVLAFGKGIGTRRKSTAGSVENEQKPESSESGKGKTVAKAGKEEPTKKIQKVEKAVKKEKTLVKSKKKTKATEVHTKKSHEEGKKNSEKDKEDHSNTKEQAQKKVKVKKEPPKLKTYPKRKEERSSSSSKRKLPAKEVKSPKPKLGSETDGSNSDELTLNIIQKKTKKTKLENEKTEASGKSVKIEPNQEEVKVKTEDRSSESEKSSSKAKKIKTEKDDKEVVQEKKLAETSKESKKTKETESDTDEDLELKKIVAKKLGRNFKIASEPKKKSSDSGKSGSETEQRARRMRLFGFWSGPKRHRVASLNALAKVHCLYENESKGVMAEIEKMGQIAKPEENKTEKKEEKLAKSDKKVSTSKKSGKDSESEKLDSVVINKRTLRGTPGTRGAGKHWDMFTGDSTSSSASSDESHSDTDRPKDRKLALPPSYRQKMQKKEDLEKDESSKAPKRRRNTEIGLAMDLKDMVVQKRIASLNASAIMSLSYSSEKRSNRKDSSGTSTEDGTSSVEDNERLLSADEGENVNNKTVRKKSSEPEKPPEEKVKENESDSEVIEYKHKKHFWKTKVESLKKLSKEKRNSPSPILAEYGVERDFTTRVFEKEKNDVLHDDKEKDKKGSNKLGYPEPKGKVKGKSSDGKQKNKTGESEKESMVGNDESKSKRKYSKRKMAGEEMKNINIEKMSGDVEKTDEYEYKSDSDNGKRKLIELRNTGGSNKKVAVIVNQDTDVTITGVYVNSTRSTHHEGFCSIAGMQYRISSTSHTQTEATAMLKTSTASEQSPPPTEPTNCSSPRTHKSYTPLSALSNMQPPAGAPSHPHLPPPPHHHHHLCGMGQHRPPPDHYMGHGPISHQRTISPLGRRHGCSSAFSAPHCSSHPGPVGPSSPAQEGDAFGSSLPSHGYFQPAGPLIHHHSSSSGPLKNQNLTSLDSSSTSESQRPGSNNEEPLESTGRTGGENPAPPPPPPSTAHHMGYPRGYPPYQSGYYQGGYYPPPPQSAHYQPPPPPPAFHQHYHHHQDLCYPPGYPPSSYPPPPGSYRRFLQPPSSYYSPELTYGSSGPPPPQDHGAQQMVVPGGPSSSYSGPLDSYPPPAPYYPGYTPGPSPACYSHPPSSRNLAFIEQTYQSCPCPMQLCPKNVHIGPLTGECKRPGTSLPLPPVALHLPQEPPGAAGPPSPARGSAGMPPQPSPVSSTARPNHGPTWDGRPVKSTTEMKWEESKTSLEVKPSTKYKTDTLNYADTKEIWNLSNRKSDFTELEAKSAESVENQWNVSMDRTETKPESFSQGLLAISSKDMLLTARTQLKEANAAPTEHVEDGKIVKSEKGTTFPEVMEPSKSSEQTNHRKCESFEQKPETKINENILTSEEGSKKRKRKAEATTENLESKVKKVKKSESGKRRSEDEKECADGKVSGKSQKSQMVDVKAKLLKDRNETVLKNEERSEEEKETKTDKIIPRRQSIQERASKLCYLVYEVLRKSRSCSPSRSRIREPSPSRLLREDSKRKLETTRKSKPETKTKTIQEHSRPSGKGGRKGSGGTKAKVGKQVTVLTKCSQTNATPSSKSKKAVSILKKSVSKKALTGSPRTIIAPKWSNGWSWDSESFDAKVYLTNDEPPVTRKCYTAMRHVEGDVIHPRDCILLKAGPRRIDLPFVAKVAALWENPDDGEMMVSLLWYYRPEHTDQGRQPSDEQDEIFASRHKDINSVACIEDKCFVLTYNEYCRYRKDVRRVEEGVAEKNSPVPRLEQPYFRVQRQPPCVMAPDMVFFCRRVYDFRQKRLLKNPA